MRHTFSLLTLIAVTAVLSACTVSKTPAPPLQGPSELGLSLSITASPDVLSMDGASQSRITIEAHDPNGQLAANVPLRVEIMANGELVDFGSLSARSVVTGSNGRATVIYTAPMSVSGAAIPSLNVLVTPAGSDTNGEFGCVTAGLCTSRFIGIRLVPPGVIVGSGPTPSFTVTPASPAAFANATFDASASTAGLGAGISSYSWNFGDGSANSGVSVTHKFSSPGTYKVVLTVTDTNGVSASTSKDVQVGTGSAPTANFTFSPAAPVVNQTINFNGGVSTAGTGHSIVRYDWDFGSGSNQSGITVSKAYDVAGSYNVTLTVTDESGQTGQVTKSVAVSTAPGGGSLVAAFTKSPTDPHNGDTVNFNASTSTASSGSTITNYAWDFGDGTGSVTNAGPQTSHVYVVTVTHTYTVTLTITDSLGRTATTTGTVQITFP